MPVPTQTDIFRYQNRAVTQLTRAIDSVQNEIYIEDIHFLDFSPEAEDPEGLACVLRGPEFREIIHIHPQFKSETPPDQQYIWALRGRQGTIARDWPKNTLLFLSTTAEAYENILQRDSIRTVDFNPNGVVSPNYRGEKILQNAGCGVRWWQSFNNVDPYWHLIAGEPCDGEEFINPTGSFVSNVWVPAPSGIFTFKDISFDSNSFLCCAKMSGPGPNPREFLLAGTQFNSTPQNHILSFEVSPTGQLTYKGSRYDGGNIVAVATRQGYPFAAGAGGVGIYSWALSPTGLVFLQDSRNDTPGGGLHEYRDIYFDPVSNHYICAVGQSGLATYEQNTGSGALTFKDQHYRGDGHFNHVSGDGNFIYASATPGNPSGTGSGIATYSIDGAGNLTFIDYHLPIDDPPGSGLGGEHNYNDVKPHEGLVFLASANRGIFAYEISPTGIITHKTFNNIFGNPTWLTSHNEFLIRGDSAFNGIFSYTTDANGVLTEKDNFGTDRNREMDSDGTFLYAPRQDAGLVVFEVE